jgi:predicted kinase
MDLEARGRPDFGYYFSEQYEARCRDAELFKLLPFYRCYRAYVRGKVQSFRLDEAELTEPERETVALRARRYFELAGRYASPLHLPTVIAVTGLAGSGKTALARAIAGELGLRVVSSDAIRKTLFEIKERPEYGAGPYSAGANRLTYASMVQRGRDFLSEQSGVVLDSTFRRRSDRTMAREMAFNAGAEWRVIECRLLPERTRERLERRAMLKDGLSDAIWETYLQQQSEFEPLDPGEGLHLEIDTSADPAVVAHKATDWLRERDQ